MLAQFTSDPGLPGPPAAFTGFAVLVGLIVVAGIATSVYRAARLSKQGVNPLTLQEDLAARALRSEALAPPRTKSDRLAELDGLHREGRISDAERDAARARILAE